MPKVTQSNRSVRTWKRSGALIELTEEKSAEKPKFENRLVVRDKNEKA